MKVLIKVLLSSFIVLAMMVSLNVSAEEKAKKPAVAIEIAVSKGDEALAVLKKWGECRGSYQTHQRNLRSNWRNFLKLQNRQSA